MEKRRLGNSGLQITPLVLGGNVFGWTIDEARSFAVLDAFAEAGGNLIDTADVYSNWAPGNRGGESEAVIGSWLRSRGKRQDVFIATKVGGDMGEGKNLRKKYIIRAAEASLRRLYSDYIDLYQSHWDDPETPVEETLEAFDQLIKDGKVRAIGASNFSKDRLKASLDAASSHSLPKYSTHQPSYNLYDREEFEKEHEELAVREGLGVIPYFGLASGFLTGKYRSEADQSKSARGGGMGKYLNPRGTAILGALDKVAERYRTKPAAVALAWLAARPSVTAPIASATSVEQLKEIMGSLNLQLDSDAIAELDKASAY